MYGYTLGVVAVMHLVAAAAFLIVARALLRREHEDATRAAALAFVTWWTALGAYMAVQAGLFAYAALTEPAVDIFLLARAVKIPMLVVAVWGLVFHILYLYTGRSSLGTPLALGYAVVGALFFVAGFLPVPGSVEVSTWHVALEGEGQTPLYRATYGILGTSIMLSILGYASMLPRLRNPVQRMRVVLVSASLLLWVGSGLVAFTSTSDLAKFVALVGIGLLTAGAVLVAYYPPRRLVAWLERPRKPRTAGPARSQLLRRAAELV